MKSRLLRVFAWTVFAAGHLSAADSRPNIVFILADDCTYNMLGCYGGKDASTPNIDRLANEGLKFTRAYSSMAMCAPFRAELYTGLYPVRSGVTWNHSSARPGTKSVCHYLGDAGYRVALSGKKHANPASVFPFENLKDFPAGKDIRRFMTRDPKQPFCLFLCSHNSHAPWTTGDASHFDAEKIALNPTQHDNPETRDAMTRYLAEVEDLDRETGEILALLESTGLQDNTLVMFSSEQGWALGFAKWSNWDLGVHTALIARWPGKIEAGRVSDSLVQMTDVLPTFLEAAGTKPEPGQFDGHSFLGDLTAAKPSDRTFIYGLHNNVPEGHPYPIRSIRDGEFHLLLNLTPETSYHEKHVMTKNSRLVWWPALQNAATKGDSKAQALMDKYQTRPAEELYQVDTDPFEINNLADNPEFHEVKEQLRAELSRWMSEQGDPGAAIDTAEAFAANGKAAREPGPKPKKPTRP
ncbi:MAG: sulfatase [Verrucomicrobia bacterium]|nr:sulfatase [Verrucomicrobiota bacterium]